MALRYTPINLPASNGGFLSGLNNGYGFVSNALDQAQKTQQDQGAQDTLTKYAMAQYAPAAAGASAQKPLTEYGLPDSATLQAMVANPETRPQAMALVQAAQAARAKAADPLTNLELQKEGLEIQQLKSGGPPTELQRDFQYSQNNPAFMDFISKKGAGKAPQEVQQYLFYRDQAQQAGETPMPFVDFKKISGTGAAQTTWQPITAEQRDSYGIQDTDKTPYEVSSAGQVRAISGSKPAQEFNSQQASAAGYADRMTEADKILNDPATLAAQVDLGQRARGSVPVAGNFLTSPDYQSATQAQRDFINAILRRESGAAISQSEFDNGQKQYFAQPGDSSEVLQQKARNRQMAIKGVARAAGPNYAPPSLEAAGTPQPGDVEDGYKFKGGDPSDQANWEPAK